MKTVHFWVWMAETFNCQDLLYKAASMENGFGRMQLNIFLSRFLSFLPSIHPFQTQFLQDHSTQSCAYENEGWELRGLCLSLLQTLGTAAKRRSGNFNFMHTLTATESTRNLHDRGHFGLSLGWVPGTPSWFNLIYSAVSSGWKFTIITGWKLQYHKVII